jgi:hypothetical protein
MPAKIELFVGSKLCEPAFQNLLVRRRNFGEQDTHSIRSTIDDLTLCSEGLPPVINLNPDSRPLREWSASLDEAAEDTQVAGASCKIPFQLEINHLDACNTLVGRSAMVLHLLKAKYELVRLTGPQIAKIGVLTCIPWCARFLKHNLQGVQESTQSGILPRRNVNRFRTNSADKSDQVFLICEYYCQCISADLLLFPYRCGTCHLALLVRPFCCDSRDLPVLGDHGFCRANHSP